MVIFVTFLLRSLLDRRREKNNLLDNTETKSTISEPTQNLVKDAETIGLNVQNKNDFRYDWTAFPKLPRE